MVIPVSRIHVVKCYINIRIRSLNIQILTESGKTISKIFDKTILFFVQANLHLLLTCALLLTSSYRGLATTVNIVLSVWLCVENLLTALLPSLSNMLQNLEVFIFLMIFVKDFSLGILKAYCETFPYYHFFLNQQNL